MLKAESRRRGPRVSPLGQGSCGRQWAGAILIWATRLVLAALLLLVPALAGPRVASANQCPPGLIDQPALTRHLEQNDIAKGKYSFKEIFDFGRQLFITNFNACDGAGRPGTNAAAGLHGVGAPRPIDALEGPRFTGNSGNLFDPAADCIPVAAVTTGASIHHYPTANVPRVCRDGEGPGTPTVSDGPFNLFTERGSLGLFGSGAIELLSREMTQDMWSLRDAASAKAQSTGLAVTVDLVTKGVYFGKLVARPDGSFDVSQVEGVNTDLVVRPFGRKGQNKSLRHFSNQAFNRHLGMQPEEGVTEHAPGDPDPDKDGFERELTVGDITAVMIFQAALPVPRRVTLKPPESAKAVRGERLFSEVGCTGCHIPALPLRSTMYCEPNPLNTDGDFRDTSQSYCFDLQKTSGLKGKWVYAYTDLKRHSICDPTRDYDPQTNHFCDDPPRTRTLATDGTGPGDEGAGGRPAYHEFLTAKLWDTGNSAPWGHRNDLDTLYEAIVAHGGEAMAAVNAFEGLPEPDQLAVVIFLKTLQMPVMDGNPAPQEAGSPRAPNPGTLGASTLSSGGGVKRFTFDNR
jgi:hypothetical protein